MASALIEEMKTVATEVKRRQLEDAVSSSWANLAAEEDPQRRGIEALLVDAGAEGGDGGGEGGAGMLNSKNNGSIRRQPRLIWRIS